MIKRRNLLSHIFSTVQSLFPIPILYIQCEKTDMKLQYLKEQTHEEISADRRTGIKSHRILNQNADYL